MSAADPSLAIPGTYERLPCGCEFWSQPVVPTADGPAFVMRPCSLDCPAYRYAISQTRAQGKPVEYRVQQR